MNKSIKEKTKIKRTYYGDKQLKSETRIVSNLEHGVCRVWYPNGQIKDERIYTYGKMNGKWKEWHENGQLSWESDQTNGESYNSIDRGWNEDGVLVYSCPYKEGKIHGKYYKRDSTGKEIREYWLHDKKLKYNSEHTELMIDFLSNLGYEIKPINKAAPTPG
ncbi:toxin-antitoxin system YwqK family antitoxin [Spirosoma pollinicola]|uniref:Toxin-antitoxin system YwqK family antitoxin n=1 Tax=Spirosoma pollinicola TaxID=2057025 RepID=A0A2K8YWY2_9BACT|nr:hypothetical protein [Spirosoma pollinicola]AUD02145.1 hypothetical protein CWM47_10120 [Spirosoma pollinicola]